MDVMCVCVCECGVCVCVCVSGISQEPAAQIHDICRPHTRKVRRTRMQLHVTDVRSEYPAGKPSDASQSFCTAEGTEGQGYDYGVNR